MKLYFRLLVINIFFILASGQMVAQDNKASNQFPFQDSSLDTDQRIDDLINRLTLEEKAGQMMHDSPAIDRLGIPEYNWWNEALHGIGRAGVATIFPQAIGMGATFDEDLILRVAIAISDEARGNFNTAVKNG